MCGCLFVFVFVFVFVQLGTRLSRVKIASVVTAFRVLSFEDAAELAAPTRLELDPNLHRHASRVHTECG